MMIERGLPSALVDHIHWLLSVRLVGLGRRATRPFRVKGQALVCGRELDPLQKLHLLLVELGLGEHSRGSEFTKLP